MGESRCRKDRLEFAAAGVKISTEERMERPFLNKDIVELGELFKHHSSGYDKCE